MRSLIGVFRNVAPISYTPNGPQVSIPWAAQSSSERQMRSFGSVSTLFAIVDQLATGTAEVRWRLYRKSATGHDEDRIEVTTPHAARTVWEQPNEFMDGREFREASQQFHDLTGEIWWIIVTDPRFPKLVLELWPVRPDRMFPVPHKTKFLAGYLYRGPNGEEVPLDLDQVIFIKRPNPLDPYRGMGPVQSLLHDLDSAKYSAEWQRNFFTNGAEPGGIIQVDKRLGDIEWEEMRDRWQEQHKGVANAHRVAILEQGTWVDRKYTNRDMQFAELRGANREIIREAFAMHGHRLGLSESVNRANADAADVTYGRAHIVPRLNRLRAALNTKLLPKFGDGSRELEWDYDNPVPEDREADNAERESKAKAAKVWIELGFERVEVLDYLDVPEMSYTEPEPPPAAAPPGTDSAMPTEPAMPHTDHGHARISAGAWPVRYMAAEDAEAVDLTPVQEEWEKARDRLVGEYVDTIVGPQREQLVAEVVRAVEEDDLAALASLSVDTAEGAALVEAAMEELATKAAEQVAAEAAAQGVEGVVPYIPLAATLGAVAAFTTAMLGAELALAAGREAVRVRAPGMSGKEVGDAVNAHLRSLTEAFPAQHLGGALTGAQNGARIETMRRGPVAALYANETLDSNTCGPCRAIDGRWLGNSDNGTDMEQVERTYPLAGYIDCLGGNRCRGTITGVWRSKTAEGGE